MNHRLPEPKRAEPKQTIIHTQISKQIWEMRKAHALIPSKFRADACDMSSIEWEGKWCSVIAMATGTNSNKLRRIPTEPMTFVALQVLLLSQRGLICQKLSPGAIYEFRGLRANKVCPDKRAVTLCPLMPSLLTLLTTGQWVLTTIDPL